MSSKQIIIVIIYVLILSSIPVGLVMLKNSQILSSQASQTKVTRYPVATSSTKLKEVPKTSSLDDLKGLIENPKTEVTTSPQPTSTVTITPTPTVNLAFGPILNAKISLEGKAANNMAAKVFMGIGAGNSTVKPTYLLSFTVDFPASGVFSGISLAGLNPGSTYTAYVKGPAQIDQSSTFIMSPTESNLNNSQPLILLSGDMNEDNTINSADLSIVKNSYGAAKTSSMWNERADINGDGVINNIDISFVIKNFGKIGSSGVWYSPVPTATGSASLQTASPQGSPDSSTGGYWLWLPPIDQ